MTPPLETFSGGALVDRPVAGVIRLSLLDVLDRGMKHNLGLLLSQQQTVSARAQRWRELSELLPNVAFRSSESLQQVNLAAFGIPFTLNGSTIVGPFAVFDARPTVSERLLDFSALSLVRSASENEKAARFTVQDARELVVLVVGNEYLVTLADIARLETTRAQFATADTIYQRTVDLKKAGVAAGIDVLRSQVQMQQQQQRLLAAENQVAKQRMVLARVIGLPVTQQIELTDPVPVSPMVPINLEESIARAYSQRPDYLAAEARLRAAELQLKAARDEALPTVDVNGDYGWIGPAPGSARQTFGLAAGIRIPIFQGGRVRADKLQAQSNLDQQRRVIEDMRNRIELEVRSAWFDVNTATQQVEVARQSVDLAAEQLKQAQDRYAAGVSGSLEVVQSQESVAMANESYIQSLYQSNVAKLMLARSLGVAESQSRAFLSGR